jgi:hypothetical protein
MVEYRPERFAVVPLCAQADDNRYQNDAARPLVLKIARRCRFKLTRKLVLNCVFEFTADISRNCFGTPLAIEEFCGEKQTTLNDFGDRPVTKRRLR